MKNNFFDPYNKDITVNLTQDSTSEFGTWIASVEALGISEMGVSARMAFQHASEKVISMIHPSINEDPEFYKFSTETGWDMSQ